MITTSPTQPTPSAEGLLPLIQGKSIFDYLDDQFPATTGHLPLRNWIHQVSARLSWNRRPTAAVPRSVVEQATPPILSEWRHGNGYLICGTLRIARADFDTDPSPGFKRELFDWICTRLNHPYLSQPPTEERTSEEPCAQKETRQPSDSTKKLQGSNVNTRSNPGASNAPSDVPSGTRGEAQAWRPIEICDVWNRNVLCWEEDWIEPYIAVHHKPTGEWLTMPGQYKRKPTHWQPLPAAPQPTATEETDL